MTVALVYFVTTSTGATRFERIDVGRIDVREPDGTLRMTVSNAAQSPGIIVKGREFPHPDRRSAGIVFFNDEGTENGGLIFDGRTRDGVHASAGSLTFDRYEQDQVVQVVGSEQGETRSAGVVVSDRPEARIDFAEIARLAALAPAQRTPAAYAAANVGGHRRLFVGRDVDKAAKVALRDGEGLERLVLRVDEDGSARIDFLDQRGQVTRTMLPSGPYLQVDFANRQKLAS